MSKSWEADAEKRAVAYRELLGAKTVQGLSDEVILLNRARKEARVGVNWRTAALHDEVMLRVRLGRVEVPTAGPDKGRVLPGPSAEAWELAAPAVEPEPPVAFICKVLKNGLRVHDSIRQHDGGPETARRVLVLGDRGLDKESGYQNDLLHLGVEDVRELMAVFADFVRMSEVSGGGARETAGDVAVRLLGVG